MFGLLMKPFAPLPLKRIHYAGKPDKFFSEREGKYIHLSDAEEIARYHGAVDVYYDGTCCSDDEGATCLILKKDGKYYLVVRNYCHSGLHMADLESGNIDVPMGIMECRSLDEAEYYSKEQMEFWIKPQGQKP